MQQHQLLPVFFVTGMIPTATSTGKIKRSFLTILFFKKIVAQQHQESRQRVCGV